LEEKVGGGDMALKHERELERETEVEWDIFRARCRDSKNVKANYARYTLMI
jgi:hypothetical protein